MKVKVKNISVNNEFDYDDFEKYIFDSKVEYYPGLNGISIDDDEYDINQIILDYKKYRDSGEKKPIEDMTEDELKERQERLEANEKDKLAALEEAQEAEKKRKALSSMLITSGFNFDGYTITKYSGYISGDDAVQVPRNKGIFFATAVNVGDALMESLVKIRRQALKELKEAAYNLGCNAVIGVDFDYITLDPETSGFNNVTTYLPYVFGVTANGNAVVIEKNNKTKED